MLKQCQKRKWSYYNNQLLLSFHRQAALIEEDAAAEDHPELLLELERSKTMTASDFALELRRCGRAKDLAAGKRLHDLISKSSLELGIPVRNLLVEMFGNCGETDAARKIFDEMLCRNGFSWNIMIAAYAQNGDYSQSLEVFRMMICDGLRPDRVTCIEVLDAFGSLGFLQQGSSFHRSIVCESGFELDVIVGTALLTMYNRCGSVSHAKQMFDRIPGKNVVSWSAMIAAFAQHGRPSEALQLFVSMDQEGVKANAITLVSVLDACANLGKRKLQLGQRIHARALSGGLVESDVILCNTLIHMYGRCGQVEQAKEVFRAMNRKNTVTWNAMIAACSRHELQREAFELLGRMDLEGLKPNKVTFVSVIDVCAGMEALSEGQIVHQSIAAEGLESDYAVGNALVNLYGKCGKLKSARRVLEGISGRDEISWTTLLAAYAQQGQGRKAFGVIIKRMDQEGIKSDSFTFVTLIECCISIVTSAPADREEQASELALHLGEELHDRIIYSGIQLNTVLQTALVDMYGKCGNPEAARRVFDRIPVKHVAVWNALLAAYALRDQGKEALEIFSRMNLEGMKGDKVTFLGIFDACASLTALAQGKLMHLRMVECGLEADVLLTTAVINMFAKCGSLEEAKKVFDEVCCETTKSKQEKQMHHDVIAWGAMVAAYSQFGMTDEALHCFCRMQQEGVRPDSVSFVSVFSACSYSGLVAEAVKYFTSLRHDYGILPSEAHFGCFIDLLSRAGWLWEAEKMIKRMPYKAYLSTWMTLLSACRTHGDVLRARRLAVKLSFLRPVAGGPYALLASVFCLDRKWDDVRNAKQSRVERGLIKQPGCSWIEIRGKVHEFFGGDDAEESQIPREEEVLAELQRISVEIRKVGYERDPIRRVHDPGEQEKKFLLGYHSEKVAVVFGLISTPEGAPIRVVKNIGTCRDCHLVIKCIAKLSGRVISLRDSRGFHQFSGGTCSCGDRFS